jgi:hypothetical protein
LLERQGVSSSRLLRTRLGALQLERTLPRGRWRELSDAETEGLLHPPATPAAPATLAAAVGASALPGNPGSDH